MDHKTYQPQMPDIMEAVFDAVYLLFDLVAGIVFFAMAQGRPLFVLYGILTLTLCGGDAFHLVPRIFRAFRGSTPKIKHLMGTGLQISSITMTAFYVILLFIWKLTFPGFAAPAAGLRRDVTAAGLARREKGKRAKRHKTPRSRR